MTPITEELDPQLLSDARAALTTLHLRWNTAEVASAMRAVLAEQEEAPSAFGVLMDDVREQRQRLAGYFEQAWEMWPLPGKRRSAKAKARERFNMIARKIGPQKLLDAVNAYVLTPDAEKDGGAYVPALDRWLSQGRHVVFVDDDLTPPRIGFV